MGAILRGTALALLLSGAAAATGATEHCWYGYTKLDMAYDTAESSHGNFAMWVKAHAQDDATGVNSITARQTRLGLNAKRDDVNAKLEFDFYGSGAENKAHIQMRLAYVDVPLGGLQLRAGQDADLFSPLVPATINYTVCWGVGNVGYRRPQLRLYKDADRLFWGVAVARNIAPDLNGDSIADGDAGTPVAQARVDLGVPAGDLDMTVGVSGHYGRMDAPGAAEDDYETWSLNGSMTLGIRPSVKLLAEAYVGSNMATYFGSILNGDAVGGLASMGGWANLQVAAAEDLSLSVGAGLDTVDEDDLAGAAARSSNMVVFANAQRVIASGVKAGVEVSYWTTEYPYAPHGMEGKPTDLRLQFAVTGSL